MSYIAVVLFIRTFEVKRCCIVHLLRARAGGGGGGVMA